MLFVWGILSKMGPSEKVPDIDGRCLQLMGWSSALSSQEVLQTFGRCFYYQFIEVSVPR